MTSHHPFRFGLLLERAITRPAVIETARRAEDAGFATLLIRDHFIEEPFGHQLAPLTTLAGAAGVTTTLRLGTHVLANDYRHPVLLAQEAATLDVLSDGRFELGLGAGFSRAEYERAGIPFERAGTRVARLEESIAVLKGLFGGSACQANGRYYHVNGLDGFPKPAQAGGLPLLIAGTGPRMLALAAREADIVAIQSVATTSGSVVDDPAARFESAIAEKVELVRRAAGERFAGLELSSTLTVCPADRPAEAAADVARQRGWTGIAPADVLAMPSLAFGTPDRIADTLRERRSRLGLSYYVVGDAHLDRLAPIVARLAGE